MSVAIALLLHHPLPLPSPSCCPSTSSPLHHHCHCAVHRRCRRAVHCCCCCGRPSMLLPSRCCSAFCCRRGTTLTCNECRRGAAHHHHHHHLAIVPSIAVTVTASITVGATALPLRHPSPSSQCGPLLAALPLRCLSLLSLVDFVVHCHQLIPPPAALPPRDHCPFI